MTRYWLGVIHKDHIQRGVAGGFIQLNHGKKRPLQRMAAGDWLVIYSPRRSFDDNEAGQALTAIGRSEPGLRLSKRCCRRYLHANVTRCLHF